MTTTSEEFPNLSQISVPEGVTISRLLLAKPNIFKDKHQAPKKPEQANKKKISDASPAVSTATAPVVFGSPPKRRGLSRRAEKAEALRNEMKEAKHIVAAIQEKKKARVVRLSHMDTLRGPYTMRSAKPLVDQLDLPPFEIDCALIVRMFNVGQKVPVIKPIPQAACIRHAIKAIEATNNLDLLARWEGYDCATYDRLKLVKCVTHDKNAVAGMNLGRWYIRNPPPCSIRGRLLGFRDNLWLHSSSIIGALFNLREMHEGVGVINLRLLDFGTIEPRARTARSFGATDPGITRAISVVNLGNHWDVFAVSLTRCPSNFNLRKEPDRLRPLPAPGGSCPDPDGDE
ncbi:unnamed protein product [Phytophthora lilii]|uniref:Unnamed protein product n=1 Tax=Phytophthora lilii TaxID=2077276 RepID=A0A9W6U4C9_9STRA|nr:unnamed protein product [Phytophthora lilii]